MRAGSLVESSRFSRYSLSSSRRVMPCTIEEKYGSPKNMVVSSGTMSAMAPEVRLASERAARLGT